MIYLLDANVLIALIDTTHAHHAAAVRFFPIAQRTGWATCPIVENAFIRIFGRPGYRNGPGTPDLARTLLAQYCAAPGHRFLPDDATLLDLPRFPSLRGSMSLTDLYLLGLAVKHGGRFATFDAGIDASLVPGGETALLKL
ncbi:MAG: PIN domain-containing protein [Verrucomicrobiae bacterium]|nr:PIN domain-containing protein [Verrucomicrobiae bacterium]